MGQIDDRLNDMGLNLMIAGVFMGPDRITPPELFPGSFDTRITYPPIFVVDNFLSISHEEITASPYCPPSRAMIFPLLPLEL